MSNSNKILFSLVGAIVLCVAGLGIVGSVGSPRVIDPSRESINMVQPFGWWPDRDSQYAEHVNKPNSEANRNNAEANNLNAQATKTVSEAQWNDQQRMDSVGSGLQSCLAGMGCMAFLIFLIAGIASSRSGEKGE